MKKNLIFCAFAIMAVILIVTTATGKVTKSTGKDATAIIPAVDMFPGSVYDNIYQIPGAKGKVNMIQPNGNVDVILAVSADGLSPNSPYNVWFDMDGVTPGAVGTAGPWSLMGNFLTDEYGHGEWNYTAPAGVYLPGTYTPSMFINIPGIATVLISYNVEFEIETE
ncbi:MAG: hypothetical protein JW715_13830 [Sedimentisphaerales bacterium]|nr:hypothetical protein [Sedimentisphaerales bacterium]